MTCPLLLTDGAPQCWLDRTRFAPPNLECRCLGMLSKCRSPEARDAELQMRQELSDGKLKAVRG
jgi:hypothetical protein